MKDLNLFEYNQEMSNQVHFQRLRTNEKDDFRFDG